jgi:type VI secretion system protein ImpH
MQATKRKHEPGVIALLLDEPHRFQFAQLLNILLSVLRRKGIPYENAFGEVLRFRNSLSLAFPASEVGALDIEPKAPLTPQDVQRALYSGEVMKIRITPAFIGLLGSSGTLPLHDTERIAARQSLEGDASQRELVDVFSNRMIGLYYEAWGKYRVEHGIDVRGQDRLLPMLVALAGVRTQGAGQRPRTAGNKVKDNAAAYYSGLLRTRPVSAATVERVLSEFFHVPIRLEQFVGCWDPIRENRRSTLGTATPKLGLGAALGVRLWRHDLRARLDIGPLEPAQVSAFLPGGGALHALEEMAALFAVPATRYEVRLLLAPSCIKRMTLTTRSEPTRLGWDTFLTSTHGVAHRPEIRSMLRLGDPSRRTGTSERRAL